MNESLGVWGFVAFIVAFIVFDAFLALSPKHRTVSQIIYRWSKENPNLLFYAGFGSGAVIGILLGHLWPVE